MIREMKATKRDKASDERRETQEASRTEHGVDDDSTDASAETTKRQRRAHTEREERENTR